MGSIDNFHYRETLLKRGIDSTEKLVRVLRDCEYHLLKFLNIPSLVHDLVEGGYLERADGEFILMQSSVVKDYDKVSRCAISSKKDLYREWQLFYGTVNRLGVPSCYAPMVLLMYLCYYDREFEVYLREDRLTTSIDARGICDSIYRFMYQLKIREEKSYRAVGFLFTGFSKTSIEKYLNIKNSEEFYCGILDRLRAVISVDMARKQMFSVV